LFGFHEGFAHKLSTVEQQIHFVSIVLTVIAVAPVMMSLRAVSPAATWDRIWRATAKPGISHVINKPYVADVETLISTEES